MGRRGVVAMTTGCAHALPRNTDNEIAFDSCQCKVDRGDEDTNFVSDLFNATNLFPLIIIVIIPVSRRKRQNRASRKLYSAR